MMKEETNTSIDQSPQTGTHTYKQFIFNKEQKQHNGTKVVFSKDGGERTAIHIQKEKQKQKQKE